MNLIEKLQSKHQKKTLQPLSDKGSTPDRPRDDIPAPAAQDPVKALLDYLKTCQGIYLMVSRGRPVLHFNPGLTLDQKDRWHQARTAIELLFNAREKIIELIKTKDLPLPRRYYG